MVTPPSTNLAASATTDDLALLRRVTAFGQELAGTLRRASVIDLLLRHIRESLAPTEIALTLFHRDADAQDFVHAWPAGRPDRRPLLAARRAPRAAGAARRARSAGRARATCRPSRTAAAPGWSSPFVARGRVTGAVGDPRRARPLRPAGRSAAAGGPGRPGQHRPRERPAGGPPRRRPALLAGGGRRHLPRPLHRGPRRPDPPGQPRLCRSGQCPAREPDRPPLAGVRAARVGRRSAAGPGAARSGPRGGAPHRRADLCGYRGADYQHRPIHPRAPLR